MADIQLSDEDRAFIEERVRRGPYKTTPDAGKALSPVRTGCR